MNTTPVAKPDKGIFSEFFAMQDMAKEQKRNITLRRLKDGQIELLLIGEHITNHHIARNNQLVSLKVYDSMKENTAVHLFAEGDWQVV